MKVKNMKGKKELSLDELEFVIGGMMNHQAIDNLGGPNQTANVVNKIQCPKCLKYFTLNTFSTSEFESIHVDKCLGPDT